MDDSQTVPDLPPMSLPGRSPTRILIVDDHTFFRRGLRDVLNEEQEMEVVAEAGDGHQAEQLVRRLLPHGLDLVLMDIEMPGMDGIEATRAILASDASLPVIMLTISSTDHDLFEAMLAGAAGFLSKSLSPAALVRTLRDFRDFGALPMSRSMAARVLAFFQHYGADAPVTETTHQGTATGGDTPQLTPREREVLELIASGYRDREIAGRLIVAETTVKKHVQSILRKLAAQNRTHAAAHLRGGVA
jgi:DNA-binding NarL/FixJ family response regulator